MLSSAISIDIVWIIMLCPASNNVGHHISRSCYHALQRNIHLKVSPMTSRNPLLTAVVCLVTVCLLLSSVIAQTPTSRDERLWQRALAIHRRAIVIDSHNDITTPMTNDDYDLNGTPPAPYRTSIARMKQGGLTAEFFSLYVKPWYVQHG